MRQKRIAAIHDISGVGKCSLTVALPVISATVVECCALPT
ncbi:MAG: pyridoxine kinase, partial [Acutalibacteraceae bacterium]|nr:pyridoxine kinase [Acutalibacteraceae bacterium]